MVLGAGKGTRLFSLTGVIPKPIAPVSDRPVLHTFLSSWRRGYRGPLQSPPPGRRHPHFYWSDTGKLEFYRAAQRDGLAGRVAVEVPGEKWGRGLSCSKKAHIHPSAYGHIEDHAAVGEEAEG